MCALQSERRTATEDACAKEETCYAAVTAKNINVDQGINLAETEIPRIIHLNPLKEELDLDSMGFVYRVAAMFQVKINNVSKKTT